MNLRMINYTDKMSTKKNESEEEGMLPRVYMS